jgi:excinuclease ABC subunit B
MHYPKQKKVEIIDTKHIPKGDIPNLIIELQKEMERAAEKLDFETAIMLRNKVKKLQERLG